MTGLEFLSATIGQLIWPVFIAVFCLVLREPIKSILSSPGLRSVKAGPAGIELVIDRTIDDAKRELTDGGMSEGRPPQSLEEQQVSADFTAEMRQLAKVQPRAVVMESHARLENLLRKFVDVPTPSNGRRPTFVNMRTLGRLAVEQGLLSSNEAAVLDELAVVRNAVAHSSEEVISFEKAVEYADLVQQLAFSLGRAIGHTSDDGPLI